MDTNAAPHISSPPPPCQKRDKNTCKNKNKRGEEKQKCKINEKTISNLSLATCTNVDHLHDSLQFSNAAKPI